MLQVNRTYKIDTQFQFIATLGSLFNLKINNKQYHYSVTNGSNGYNAFNTTTSSYCIIASDRIVEAEIGVSELDRIYNIEGLYIDYKMDMLYKINDYLSIDAVSGDMIRTNGNEAVYPVLL